jgi:hypothetical protein
MSEQNKKDDVQVNKAAIKLIHADGFFPKKEAEDLCSVVDGLQYVERPYGLEVPDFNLVFPGMDGVFSKMLGEDVVVDHRRSGIIRKPFNNFIHFEHFDNLNEWCFVIALQDTTFNTYHHVKDVRFNDYNQVDAKTVLDGYQFNYRNLFEWDVTTNVRMEANQGVFFRPWVFHSFEHGVVQYYRLIPRV